MHTTVQFGFPFFFALLKAALSFPRQPMCRPLQRSSNPRPVALITSQTSWIQNPGIAWEVWTTPSPTASLPLSRAELLKAIPWPVQLPDEVSGLPLTFTEMAPCGALQNGKMLGSL